MAAALWRRSCKNMERKWERGRYRTYSEELPRTLAETSLYTCEECGMAQPSELSKKVIDISVESYKDGYKKGKSEVTKMISIKDDKPEYFKAVLVLSSPKWLYPVVACRFPPDCNGDKDTWMECGRHEQDYERLIFIHEEITHWGNIPETF